MWYKLQKIYVWSDQVRPSQTPQPYQPGANTVAYYTFDTQSLLNLKTNTVDATWTGAGGYATWYKWEGYAADIDTGGSIALSVMMPSGDFTLCACVNFTSLPTNNREILVGNYWLYYSKLYIEFLNSQLYYIQYGSWNLSSYVELTSNTYTLTTGTRYRFVVTRSWSTVTMYMNGNSIWSWTDSYGNSTQRFTYYLWGSATTPAKLTWLLDNAIIENVAWSSAEVAAYDSTLQ